MKRLDLRKRAAALVWARRVSIRVDGISAELPHMAERYYRARAILDDRLFEGMNTNAIIAYAEAAVHTILVSGETFVTAGEEDGVIRLWRDSGEPLDFCEATGQEFACDEPLTVTPGASLAYLAPGYVAAARWGGIAYLDLGEPAMEGPTQRWRNVAEDIFSSSINALVFHQNDDGEIDGLCSGGTNGVVELWDAVTGAHKAVLAHHDSWVYSIAVSADGRWLASGGCEREAPYRAIGGGTRYCVGAGLRLWTPHGDDMQPQQFTIPQGHAGPIRDLAFSPDGKLLASAGDDGTVLIWGVRAHE